MKVLIVEDDVFKRNDITCFLEKKKIEYIVCEALNEALIYIHRNKSNISGIILDLGLPRYKSSQEYNKYTGLEIVEETQRLRLNIPILVNSTTAVDMLSTYSSVYGQRTEMDDYEILEEFVTFLNKRNEQ